jgi:eukaryotic-like serine/threonine-protein kinase
VTSKPWSGVAPIVEAALQRDGQARAAFVAEACGGDADLRREVDSLLAQAVDAEDFLNGTAAALILDPTGARPCVGDRVGPYAIRSRLGAGGMGEVYRARDNHLDRDVAIKLLSPVFTADAGRVARFEREARILASLNHPHIGAIYGLEHVDGVPALVLELVDGQTLAERLVNGPLAVAEAVAIAIQIAEALQAAHDCGIIHRDIKPANIKITSTGAVKMLDFGLAKDSERRGDEGSTFPTRITTPVKLSSAGAVMGTVAYMSPEQARGESVDLRTDLFSLGAVLYEMVTGRPALDVGKSDRIIEASRHPTPQPPRALNRAVPRALERVILRLLEPGRDARYQTAAAVRSDLLNVAGDNGTSASDRSQWGRYGRRIGAVAALSVVAATGVWKWSSLTRGVPTRGEYTQITHFADSATSPALSPDGRLLTFIRGANTFEGVGEIYLKALPDGEPVQLTSDGSGKMSPVFSPDGSRIAYTTINGFVWNTWVVPVVGRTPRLWLDNASGLTWVRDRVLFSEVTTGLHMNVVSADDKRHAVRAVYTPEGERGMAHLSHLSPDGAWVLIAEMVAPVWQPCRLVAMDGGSSRRVGPPGQCTSAAWSPDGQWMYFSSNGSGSFHIWRQRFPDGTPEQISMGPTEEEGIAISPDGRALLTSVGNRQSSIWVRDRAGERAISREGYAFVPTMPNSGMSQPFLTNGRLLYLVRQGAVRFVGTGETAGELWETDLETSHSEALFPGVRVSGYDVSRDGSQIVFAALDERGASHVWLGRMDHRTPAKQLLSGEADSPHFGAGGTVYYRASDGGASFIYRMSARGGLEKAVTRPVLFFQSVSPDDAWLVARVEAAPGIDSSQENLAFPTSSGRPVLLCRSCEVDWTPNAKSLIVRLGTNESPLRARTFVLALRAGETLPRFPPHGVISEADLTGLQVSQALTGAVYPADASAAVVAFVRSTTQRNIFRVPLP